VAQNGLCDEVCDVSRSEPRDLLGTSTKERHTMSRQKLRVKNIQLDNLISNLRGEVSEIVTSWILSRHMRASRLR
jgi:hypothetical protein